MLNVSWLFPVKNGRHRHGEYRTSKSDTDNLNKLLKDCMTACGYWYNDEQVARETIVKLWVKEEPGLMVVVKKLGEAFCTDAEEDV